VVDRELGKVVRLERCTPEPANPYEQKAEYRISNFPELAEILRVAWAVHVGRHADELLTASGIAVVG
jgi:hypothetical protein